ncbi:atrial natriuretic peptide receptor 1-like [Paramacrobiotus metropolitanus]|uniref:atrial natriuretic peptide receptor 1-like n=1 Tax=Paramacrobiotus metropolitanus TaxID=2943436 RepID=UPI002445DE1D|nr:atrial natriuretic peptide receptor 1-like [Paramacrobiotus metropolitanus]
MHLIVKPLFLLLLSRHVNLAPVLNISIVAVSRVNPIGYGSLPYSGPGLSIGIEYVQQKYAATMRFKLTLLYDRVQVTCADMEDAAVGMISDWHYRRRNINDTTIYVNGACLENTEMPYFMRRWNTLWISTLSANSQISDRIRNPTWIAVNDFSTAQCSQLYVDMLNKFRWTTTFVVIDTIGPSVYGIVAGFVLEDLKKQPNTTQYVRKIAPRPGVPFGNFGSVLQDIAKVSRVVLVFGHAALLRELLIVAHQMDMTNGDYVYIGLETMRNKPILGNFHWKYNNDDDTIAFTAFRSLLMVQPEDVDMPPNLDLGMQFVQRSARDYNFTYNISDQSFPNIVSSYWAILATAQFLNDSLSGAGDLDYRDGSAIARLFLNRTYTDDYGTLYLFQPLLTKIGNSEYLQGVVNLTNWANSSKQFPPPNRPFCGYLNNSPSCLSARSDTWTYVIIFTLFGFSLCAIVFCIFYARYTKLRNEEQLLLDPWWQVDTDELQSPSFWHSHASSIFVARKKSCKEIISNAVSESNGTVRFASYQGKAVVCSPVALGEGILTFEELFVNGNLLKLLKMYRGLEHQNLCRFYGLSIELSGIDSFTVFVVFSCPARGTLPDAYRNPISKDFAFTSSLIVDLLDALDFIHHSMFTYHGRLSTFNCWLDKHFTLKLMHLASDRIRTELGTIVGSNMERRCPNNAIWEHYFWVAPDAEQADSKDPYSIKATQATDIFSIGLLLYDILTRGALIRKVQNMFDSKSAISMDSPMNPLICAVEITEVLEFSDVILSCLRRDPLARPTVKTLRYALTSIFTALAPEMIHYKLFDKIHHRLCSYSGQLEQEVAARTKALKDERNRCDALIRQFLPKEIVGKLRTGLDVQPELFDSVSIMFTDLFGFATLLPFQPPHETFGLISKVEDFFDAMSTTYDVYKVEAVGDSFLVASGLPNRIGSLHVHRIANFALKILELEPTLGILGALRLKTGVHSGPCAAGVIGVKRPRYCLFGDTINVAARMCSQGIPGRVHISSDSRRLLQEFDDRDFNFEPRGLVEVKGKGQMNTFWLKSRARLPFYNYNEITVIPAGESIRAKSLPKWLKY